MKNQEVSFIKNQKKSHEEFSIKMRMMNVISVKDNRHELFAYSIGALFFMGMMIPFVALGLFVFTAPSWESTAIIIIPMFLLLIPTTIIIGRLESKQQKVKSVE